MYQYASMKDIILLTINDRKITHERLDDEVNKELGLKPEQTIFLSRHRSKTGEPTLTVHPIGNYGKAEFGGKTRTLVETSPKLMTQLLRILRKKAEQEKLYHKVCYEVTHHGPYLDTPTFFVEVGSTEEEWKKTKPSEVVAKSVLELLENYHYEKDFKEDIPVLVGIGGGHYAPRFTDIVFEKKTAFGHMIPTYQIDAGNIDIEMLKQAIEKTPNLTGVYIHKKSMKKSQATEYREYFESIGINVISSKELPDL